MIREKVPHTQWDHKPSGLESLRRRKSRFCHWAPCHSQRGDFTPAVAFGTSRVRWASRCGLRAVQASKLGFVSGVGGEVGGAGEAVPRGRCHDPQPVQHAGAGRGPVWAGPGFVPHRTPSFVQQTKAPLHHCLEPCWVFPPKKACFLFIKKKISPGAFFTAGKHLVSRI